MSVTKLPLLVHKSYDDIRAIIACKAHDESGRLPSETVLARKLNVSRATIRTALARLEYDGLVTRIHGKGTFVREKTINLETQLKEKWDFIPMLEDRGRKVTVELLGINYRQAGPEDAHLLNIGNTTDIVELFRLYRAEGKPVIYSRNIFPNALLRPNVDPILMNFQCTAYQLFESYFKERAESSLTDLIPALPDKTIACALEISTQTPLFLFKDFFITKDERILLAGENYMNDKLLKLRFLNNSKG